MVMVIIMRLSDNDDGDNISSHSIHLVYNMNVKGTGSEATGDKHNKKKARPLQANKMFSFSNMNSSISIRSCRLSF